MNRIGLALSGGGFRATVFHLGILSRLAEDRLLERVTALSTVSGGSLCAGLVFAIGGFRWPSSDAYTTLVLPEAKKRLTSSSLRHILTRYVLTHPWTLVQARAEVLARQLESEWGIKGSLQVLPESPTWAINTTCYETAKNWRFSRHRMGDYTLGYSDFPTIPVADAMAASSGFPGLVGPLEVDMRRFQWWNHEQAAPECEGGGDAGGDATDEDSDDAVGASDGSGSGDTAAVGARQPRARQPVKPKHDIVHLWDGGIYDNLGIEALLKPGSGLRGGIDFLVVSDASGRPNPTEYPPIYRPDQGLNRLVDIAKGQIEGLRSRTVISYFRHAAATSGVPGSAGRYFRIGRTPKYILERAAGEAAVVEAGISVASLNDTRVKSWTQDACGSVNMKTDIAQLSNDDFDALHRHGYTVADYILFAYGAPGAFPIRGTW